jgi:Fe2+ transport system protein B
MKQQRVLTIAIFMICLFNFPILSLFNKAIFLFGIPIIYIYVFSIWIVGIAIVGFISESKTIEDPQDNE